MQFYLNELPIKPTNIRITKLEGIIQQFVLSKLMSIRI